VTNQRRLLFQSDAAIQLLGAVMRAVRREQPYRTLALVVLPDHLHCIWSLSPGDSDYSTRWKRIKRDFTLRWMEGGGADTDVSDGRHSRGERGIWQRRFWEHQVQDDEELERCCDYIHYNPVKHGHASKPGDWPRSTFKNFVRAGHYDPDWGRTLPATLKTEGSMGD
jgi:putative transposase